MRILRSAFVQRCQTKYLKTVQIRFRRILVFDGVFVTAPSGSICPVLSGLVRTYIRTLFFNIFFNTTYASSLLLRLELKSKSGSALA